jgi:hypothetical protein
MVSLLEDSGAWMLDVETSYFIHICRGSGPALQYRSGSLHLLIHYRVQPVATPGTTVSSLTASTQSIHLPSTCGSGTIPRVYLSLL